MLRKNKTAEEHLAAADKAAAKAERAQKQVDDAKRKLEAAKLQQAALQDARTDVQARREIRQGVKADVETTPMPVRLEVSQARALKILAALEGTTSSAIIRGCVRDFLNGMADDNPAFDAALKAAKVSL